MTERSAQRLAAATRLLGAAPDRVEPASADASFRSYWRLHLGDRSFVLMDAPPGLEDLSTFLAVAERLRRAGLHPPEVIASDLPGGFALLEDLGGTLFCDLLDEDSVEGLYGQAFALLEALARVPVDELPTYDEARLREELELFPEWFLARQLGRDRDARFEAWWRPLADRLVASALEQPRVFVHRDFHCANLMPRDGQPAVLDFQDAVAGPVTYDLASLLMDRYVTWPAARVEAWSQTHRQRVAPEIDPERWRRWFDWMGLQRNLKVLGIFARLDLRDGKPRYRRWQPRFAHYVQRSSECYAEFAELARLMGSLELRALSGPAS